MKDDFEMKLLQGLGFIDGRGPAIGVYGVDADLLRNVDVQGWTSDQRDTSLPTVIKACDQCQAQVVVLGCRRVGRVQCDHGEWVDVSAN